MKSNEPLFLVRSLLLFFIIGIIHLSTSCKQKPQPIKIMQNEEAALRSIQKKYRAQELRITELEEFDTIVKNSIHISFVNAMYNLEDSSTCDMISTVIDSIIHVLNEQFKYHLIYKKTAVSFSQEEGNMFAGKSKKILKYHMIVHGQPNMQLYYNKQVVFYNNMNRLLKLNRHDSIKIVCKKVPKYDSLYFDASSILGQEAASDGDTNKFIYYFKECRNLQRNNEIVTLNLAKAYGDKYDFNTAFKYIDTTLKINNRVNRAYYLRGLYKFYVSNKVTDAFPDMKIAKELGSEDANIFLESNGE
jgi:tetratricopeptide (TPR) repeat protein